jgi:hypothetical protein
MVFIILFLALPIITKLDAKKRGDAWEN